MTELHNLREGDKITVVLSDGTQLVGELQNSPDVGPPLTSDGEAAGWVEKALVAAVHITDHDGTDYDSMDLWSERYGDEWSDVEGRAFYYTGDGYEQDTLDIATFEAGV